MNLNIYLKKNGISQASFAALVGVTQGYVSQVIAGAYKPRGKNALKWSEATKWQVTPHEINSDDYPNLTDGLPKTKNAA